MEWLFEALRVIREVRDLPDTRARVRRGARQAPPSPEPLEASAQLTMDLGAPLVAPLGPAAVPAPAPTPAPIAEPRRRRGPEERQGGERERRTREARVAREARALERGVDRGELPLAERQEIPLEQIDPQALSAVRRLRRYGFKAYLVGGCVRDLLLGLTPKDFDVATDARPEEVKSIFRNSRIIGRRFRLVHLYFRDGKLIEVSTFRANITAEDDGEEGADLLIRRDNVFGTEEEDARRRDFTINGLFYDVQTGRIIDHVGGLADIRARYLRMIGDPEIRLREDPVRILRAIRFTAKTDLAMDPDLSAAITRHKDEIIRCAPARVLEETLRLLRIGHARRTVRLMERTGLLQVLLPEIQDYLDGRLAGFETAQLATDPEEPRRLLYAHLEALDRVVARGQVSDAVVLGALLAAPIGGEGEDGGDRSLKLMELVGMIGSRIALTRRLVDHLRQIVLAQRQLALGGGAAAKGRRRRSPAQGLLKRPFFADAFYLFEIETRARGLPLDDLVEWNQRFFELTGELLIPELEHPEETTELQVEPISAEGEDGAERKPRRRRGGRGRRREAPAPEA
jgi:poly(A) polymerase